MSPIVEPDRLSDAKQTTLVLRLVTDRSLRLIHGEIVDAAGEPRGRFDSWPGMIEVVRAYLIRSRSGGLPGQPANGQQ